MFATITAQIFYVGTLIVGVLGMFALLLFAGAWAVVNIAKYLKVWHVICLAVSIRLHGKNYADKQFWWAIKDRASRGKTDARIIANFALENAPENEA